MMSDIVFIVLLIIVGLAAVIFIPQWRVKRTIPKVIRVFRDNNALTARDAKTIEQLGLKPRGMMEGMFRGRDYRQYAVTALMKAEIIVMTPDGRLYLEEQKLLGTRLGGRTTYG